MTIKCVQCGKEFISKRHDARFCSDACRKAYSRRENLMWNGEIIRGQHENDISPTGLGIIQAKCRCCGVLFRRWIDTKLARLVRNEVEGDVNWDSRAFDQLRFAELLDKRFEEVKYCSEGCQETGVVDHEWIRRHPVTPEGAEMPKNEIKIGNGTQPRRRGQ